MLVRRNGFSVCKSFTPSVNCSFFYKRLKESNIFVKSCVVSHNKLDFFSVTLFGLFMSISLWTKQGIHENQVFLFAVVDQHISVRVFLINFWSNVSHYLISVPIMFYALHLNLLKRLLGHIFVLPICCILYWYLLICG